MTPSARGLRDLTGYVRGEVMISLFALLEIGVYIGMRGHYNLGSKRIIGYPITNRMRG